MIKATRDVLQQFSSKAQNERSEVTTYFDKVSKYEKIIIIMILVNIVVMACNAFYLFITMDNFLAKKYEATYNTWRNKEVKALKRFKSGQDYEQTAERLNYMEAQEEFKLQGVSHFQEGWNTYGPLAVISAIIISTMLCTGVACCFRTYKKSLRSYESSPIFQANQL